MSSQREQRQRQQQQQYDLSVPLKAPGRPIGCGGLIARNLLESFELNAEAEVDKRTLEEKVFDTIRKIECKGHTHVAEGHWFRICPPIMPVPKEDDNQFCTTGGDYGDFHRGDDDQFCTTGGDYGDFPRGTENLGRPPVLYSLNTKFTKHLADSGMFRNHSLNS